MTSRGRKDTTASKASTTRTLIVRALLLTPRATRIEMADELARSPRTVRARSWMADFFLGVDEQEVIADRARWVDTSGQHSELAFRHADGRTVWRAGKFSTPSIKDLRDSLPPKSARSATIPITVVDGIDIGKEQARLTSEQRAMVQVASNFNCLEVPSRDCTPDYGGLVTNLATDSTQGPAASFGVPAASLLRAHFAFHDLRARSEPSTWGQTASHQVELLGHVREYFGPCVNGKVTLRGDEKCVGGGDGIAEVADRIKVGLHADAEVVFDRGPGHSGAAALTVLPAGARPLVDQVLSASVNLHSPGELPQQPGQLDQLVKAALRAAYQGAYLAAIARNRKLLMLTLIGGGVFGNSLDGILDAIAQAHTEWAPLSNLEEVRLCLYQRGSAEPIDAALRARLQTMDAAAVGPA